MSYAGTYGPDETCRHDTYWRSCADCSEVGPRATEKQVRKARERRLAAVAQAKQERERKAAERHTSMVVRDGFGRIISEEPVEHDLGLTDAQRRVLQTLADGQWHKGSRDGRNGSVLGTPASALVRMGRIERRGESRTSSPRNLGYEYRIAGVEGQPS